MALRRLVTPALAVLSAFAVPAGLPAAVEAADPVASPSFQWDGAASYDYAGTLVSEAGDVDGDGRPDALVHSMYADPNGRHDSGSLWVVPSRSRSGGSTTLGGDGMRIDGPTAWGQFGYAIAAAGDVNGDGRGDVLVTSRETDNNGRGNSGSAWVVFGRAGDVTVDTANLGAGGFRIDGAAPHDRLGAAADGVGDLNGDGLADIAVAATGSDHNGRGSSGSVYVIFGKTDTADVDLAGLGARGYRIDGAGSGDQVGAVAPLGDVNGDRRPEIVVGASRANPSGRFDAGAVWVVPGQAGTSSLDLASSSDYLSRIDGAASGDRLGSAVARAGDPDADGHPELIAGATGVDRPGRSNAGSAYVLPADGSQTIDLAHELPGWRIDAPGSSDGMGMALSGGRDINSDGLHDIAVGNPRDDRNGRGSSGASYVLYGGDRPQVTDLAASASGGFRADGWRSGDRAGTSLALTPDVSGDGRPDLLHGVPNADHDGRWDVGAVWLVAGFSQAQLEYPRTIEATVTQTLAPVEPAVERTGSARFSVWPPLPAGVTLDATTGVVAGTPAALSDSSEHVVTMTDLSGALQVRFTLRVDPLPGACANEFRGSDAGEVLTGSRGGDRIVAAGGEDAVSAAGGDDCVTGDSGNDNLDGGGGNDLLEGGEESDTLAGAGGDDSLIGGGSEDALDGGDGNDVLDGGDRNDTLRAGAGADRALGGPGLDDLRGEDGDDELHGGEELDTLEGGAGNDLVHGEAFHDRLFGDDGDDQLWGGDGSDEIFAGAGNDRMLGEAGYDVMAGGTGDDVLEGGAGGDRLHGGQGTDVMHAGSGHDYVSDTSGGSQIHAGSGKDRVDVRNRRRDVVRCGKGRDTVVADRKDKLHGCERRRRR